MKKKVLVISEQPKNLIYDNTLNDAPRLHINRCRGLNTCWGRISNGLKPCGLQENFAIQENNKSQFLNTMKVIFNHLRENGYNYYWTHYIKCSGNFKKGKLPNDFDSNVCADKWIVKEVKKYNPDYIIAFGGFAASYLFGKPIFRIKALSGKSRLRYKYNYYKKLIIFPHPAGGNPTFNEWRKNNHKKLLDSINRLLD